MFANVNEVSISRKNIVSITNSLTCLLVTAHVKNNEEAMAILTFVHDLKLSKKKLHLMTSKLNISSLQDGIRRIDNMHYDVTIHGKLMYV